MTIGFVGLTLSVGVAGIFGYFYYKLFNNLIRKRIEETEREVEESITPLHRARIEAEARREIDGTVDHVELIIIQRT